MSEDGQEHLFVQALKPVLAGRRPLERRSDVGRVRAGPLRVQKLALHARAARAVRAAAAVHVLRVRALLLLAAGVLLSLGLLDHVEAAQHWYRAAAENDDGEHDDDEGRGRNHVVVGARHVEGERKGDDAAQPGEEEVTESVRACSYSVLFSLPNRAKR